MTIMQVIEEVHRLRTGCDLNDSRIIRDINRVEMYVLNEIINPRESYVSSSGCDEETDRGTELVVPAPYDTVYVDYCCARIDKEYGDTERYNNSMIAYNTAMTEYKRFFWKNHRQSKRCRFFETQRRLMCSEG